MEANQAGQAANDDVIITLFLAAMSCPESERGAFLREACKDDPALLAEVERRVKWETRLSGFLLTPVLKRERIDRAFDPGDTVLRRFRILRVAGEGGMGVVYEALDEKLGHRIALKCPRFEFRQRLSPEARKSLSVTHPNVCRVFEIHTEETNTGEIDFLTMEFLEGETLAARLARTPVRWLETTEGMEIARQLCAGLKAVHDEGIVHRDLKSSNVMLSTGAGGALRAVIMDFGIAQGADMFSSQVRGTPSYLAPELWKGQAATVQSDLYALGVLLYEMACARKPFAEGTSWKERFETLPPPPEVREPLRSAVSRCLHPDAKRRFQSAGEVERALFSRSRRALLAGAIGLTASAASGFFIKERYWPASAVRLAILPPSISVPESDGPLINGFVHDLSYRLKTLRARRPLSVFSLAQTRSERVSNAAQAKAMFGATHVLSTGFQRTPPGWSISAELVETTSGKVVQRWNRAAAKTDMAAQLFAMQSSIVEQAMQLLHLRGEQKRQSLAPEAYADYVQGLYYARFDFESAVQAIPYFERVIAAAPDSALGYAGLAEAQLQARYSTRDKTYEGKALTALARAEQLDPEMAHVQLMAGRLAVAGGLWERGLAYCIRAAELDPRDSEAFIEMAYAYYFLNQPQQAETALRRAIAVEPAYYKPHLDMGLLHFEERNFALAEQHWQEAVRLAPGLTRARVSLASVYLAKGRLAEAEKQARESIAIRETQGALAILGAVHDRSGRYAEAIASYEQAIRMGRTYKIWADLGGAFRRAGRNADAARAFRSGLENSEEGVRNYWREAERVAWCALYHANLGEIGQTRSRATQALGMSTPPQAGTRKLLVLAFDRIQDIEAASRLLEGMPPDLLEELACSPDLSPAMRRDPRLERFTH